MTNKTYVIGDIHGGYKALVQIIERANVTTNDTLIFLGDYVDGWSETPQVIDFLIELSKKQNCIFIRGNHDELVLKWFSKNKEGINEEMWFKHGGKATVDAYNLVSEEKKELHIIFLESLKNYYLDDKNRLFVHAGFTNLNGVENEFFPKMLYWDRTLWEMAVCLDTTIPKSSVLYPSRLKIYHEIYLGHTPTTKIDSFLPLNKASVWNIDTGAAFKGPLTILDVDSKQFWQSDNLPTLYPIENGRN
jgi:serine/threonine protein phosphatase 1